MNCNLLASQTIPESNGFARVFPSKIPQITVANFMCVFYSIAIRIANCQTTAVYQLYPTIAILMTV